MKKPATKQNRYDLLLDTERLLSVGFQPYLIQLKSMSQVRIRQSSASNSKIFLTTTGAADDICRALEQGAAENTFRW